MKHRVLLLLLLALTATDSHAQWANLRVLNPQNWTWGRATVEEALLSVQPHGAYLEYGLYLTISARGTTFFDADDLLEIEYLFQLPPGATFIDSWLWVGEEIVRAELRDVWSARQEYEDIVDRQRDPSILYKHEDHYELRIYPMRRDETRRVKLTYLLPASWRGSQLEAQLPTNLTSVSDHPVSLQVLAYPEAPNPRIIQSHGALVDVAFRPHDEVVEGGQLATLPERLPRGALSFAFDAPASGVLVQTSAETDSTGAGWYQLAFLPSALVQPERTDGLIVVLDYEARATSLSAAELRAETRAALDRHLAPGDRFVLLAEDGAPTAWRTASPEELDAAFATLGPLSGFSNLTTRLAEALAFAQRARTDGLGEARRVLLVSSADQHGAEASVEQILRDVEQQRPANLAFDALSFANETTKRYRIDGHVAPANYHLYHALARRTGGRVSFMTIQSLPAAFDALFRATSRALQEFDLHTTLDGSGFCFDRFTLQRPWDDLNQGVIQVGRCTGAGPFVAEFAGLLGTMAFGETIRAEAPARADSTLASLWAGQQINALEATHNRWDEEEVQAILDLSLGYRVLSQYSAFLALEPNMGGEVCASCQDETGGVNTGTDDLPEQAAITLDAFPNPFHDRVTVRVTLPQATPAAAVRAAVHDLLGREVATLTATSSGSTFTLVWDGTDSAGRPLPSGVYLLVIETPEGRETVRLVLVR